MLSEVEALKFLYIRLVPIHLHLINKPLIVQLDTEINKIWPLSYKLDMIVT